MSLKNVNGAFIECTSEGRSKFPPQMKRIEDITSLRKDNLANPVQVQTLSNVSPCVSIENDKMTL